MRSSQEHRWSESDDLIAFYLSRHGDSQLGIRLPEVARRIGIGAGTLKMRMSNFRSLESDPAPGELSNASRQTRSVFQNHCHMTEAELRSLVLSVLECPPAAR